MHENLLRLSNLWKVLYELFINAHKLQTSVTHLKVTIRRPESKFQTFKVLSSEEDTILQESACKHLITPVWPSEVIQSKVLEQRPVSKSHNLIVLSRDPEIIVLPSIDKVVTAPSWPFRVLRQACLVQILMHLSSEPKKIQRN